jgi:hypothetical protein
MLSQVDLIRERQLRSEIDSKDTVNSKSMLGVRHPPEVQYAILVSAFRFA